MDIDLIEVLGLIEHPEGGYYRETYRSDLQIPGSKDKVRKLATAIYYYLESEDFCAWHRIASDEMWHYYGGSTLTIHVLDDKGKLSHLNLGNPSKGEGVEPQVLLPAGVWFAAEVDCVNSFTLVGCNVFPGFEWEDFELAKARNLLKKYPKHRNIIERLTRQ